MLEKVQQKKAQIDKQTIDADIRLSDFCKMYLETYKKDTVSDSWYKDLVRITDRLTEYVGNKPVGKIKPIQVQAFLNSCSDFSDNTIKKIRFITQQIFDEAVKNGATTYVFELTQPKGKTPESGRSLTRNEQAALLTTIKDQKYELFISLILMCGLRPAEAAALIWRDIDFEKQVIYINKAMKKDGTIGATKTPSSVREIPIPISLLGLLKKSRKSPFSPVCGIHKYMSMTHIWGKAKKRTEKVLGRPLNCRLYDLRHTYCTNLERAGVPINIASRLMGHSNISITSKIYTHASDEAIEIARRCINEISF